MSRVALVLVVLAACKKDPAAAPEREATPAPSRSQESPVTDTPSAPPPSAPPAAAASGSSEWAQRSGPGYTVQAPGEATMTTFTGDSRDPTANVYTYFAAGSERYEVRVMTADEPLNREIATLRDRLSFSVRRMAAENYIEDVGDVTGLDLTYVPDEQDGGRSRLFAAGDRVFHVRALYAKNREAEAARFVESFTLVK